MKKSIISLVLIHLLFSISMLNITGIEALPGTIVFAEGVDVDVYNFNDINSAVEGTGSGAEIICHIKNDIAFDTSVILKDAINIQLINDSGNDEITLTVNGGSYRHFSTSGAAVAGISMTIGTGIILDGGGTGGGIEISGNGCDITLNGCTITNCKKTAGNGGGLLISGGNSSVASLTINDRTVISNCISAGDGGGVSCGAFCNLTINQGALITGNKSTGVGGGGVVINGNNTNPSILTINGGEISYNTANNLGGGVLARNAQVLINGGEILNNETTIGLNGTYGCYGGGIAIYEQGVGAYTSLMMTGGTIKGNKSASFGGGIGLERSISKFEISGGLITENETTGGSDQGGGIYQNYTALEVSGEAVISNNKSGSGAGIFANGSTLTVKDGAEISGNIASDKGGGIYGYSTCHAIIESGSKIQGNFALSGGGVSNFTSVTVTDSVISGNKATVSSGDIEALEQMWSGWYPTQKPSDFGIILPNDTWMDYVLLNYGGGGGIYSKGTVDIKNSNIINNTSALDGGGIWMSNLKNLTVNADTIFSHNIAATGSLWHLGQTGMEEYTMMHDEKIRTSHFSAQFTNLYNNFDVNFQAGVTVIPVEVYYYKDTVNDNNFLGNEIFTVLPEEQLTEPMVTQVLGEGWLNIFKPANGYKNGVFTGTYPIVSSPTILEVLYLPLMQSGYHVEYYKDSVAPGNLIERVSGSILFNEGHQLSAEDIETDPVFGPGWKNEKKPSGSYNDGAVPGGYPVISQIMDHNIVKVLYTYKGGGSGTTYYTVTVKYEDTSGNVIANEISESKSYGSSFEKTAHAIEGYRYVETKINSGPAEDKRTVIINPVNMDYTILFSYSLDRPNLNKADHNWYVRGYPDNTIMPDGNLTRAEMAMIFYRLVANADKNDKDPRPVFDDIDIGAWYAKAITYLSDYDIIDGYADKTFRPDALITRAEIAKMASMFDNLDIPIENTFSDVPADHWAYSYISSAAHRGWIVGYEDESFRPDNKASRAEMMTLINKVLDRRMKKENLPSGVHKWADLLTDDWAYADIMEATHSHNYERSNENEYETWTGITGTGINAPGNQ